MRETERDRRGTLKTQSAGTAAKLHRRTPQDISQVQTILQRLY